MNSKAICIILLMFNVFYWVVPTDFVSHLCVPRVLDILRGHILTTAKVVMQCLQTRSIPRASLCTPTPRLKLGHTLAHTHLHSSNGSQANSFLQITMEYVRCTLQLGQGPEVVPHHLTSPRCEQMECNLYYI